MSARAKLLLAHGRGYVFRGVGVTNAPLPGFKLRPVSFAYIGYATLRVGRHMGVAASLRNE